MPSIIDALEKTESAALGNHRLAAVQANDSDELRDLLNFALSGDITFGMKQLPAPTDTSDRFSDDAMWYRQLKILLDNLSSRLVTGGKAKTAVADFLGRCDAPQRKWTERVILQDLRLSIGAKDVNKALGEMVVRVFPIPLAKPFKDLKSLKGLWQLQLKMDGARVVTEVNGRGKVALLSRSGKEWGPSFDPIKDAMQQLVDHLGVKKSVFDGEVAIWKHGRMDFQEMQTMFFPKDGRKPNGEMRYTLFDFAEADEYHEPSLFYGMRLENLIDIVGSALPDSVDLIKTEQLANPTQEYLDAKAIEYVEKYGCDGAIIRRADKAPTNRKSSDITKVKPFEDGEAVIVGKVEGNGHLVGSLGTMVCDLLVNKKRTGKIFEIGTGLGLTKEVRQDLWDDPDLVGKINMFKFQRTTNDGIPLLPSWRGIRHPNDL